MSLPEIDFNKLNDDGLTYAGDLFLLGAQVLIGILYSKEAPEEIIKKHPMLVIGIALLGHLDEQAAERRIMKEAELEILRGVSDNLEILTSTVMQLMVAKLKENWLKTFPNHTPAEMTAAMRCFESMAVKNSRLGHADE